MERLLAVIQSAPPVTDVVEAAARGQREILVEGLCNPARGPMMAAIHLRLGRQVLVVAPNEEQADKLYQDLAAALGASRVRLFPSIEMLLFENVGVDAEASADRLNALGALLTGERCVVVTSVNSLLHDVVPRDVLASHVRTIAVGDTLDLHGLGGALLEAGYRRSDLTVEPGEFSLRGGIADVYPPTAEYPYRLEFFGDEVESIREFDPSTQRSRRQVPTAEIGPASEVLLAPQRAEAAATAIEARLLEAAAALEAAGKQEAARRLMRTVREHTDALRDGRPFGSAIYYQSLYYDHTSSLMDYLAEDAVVIVDDPLRMQAHCEDLLDQLNRLHDRRVVRGELLRLNGQPFRSFDQVVAQLRRRPIIYTCALSPTIRWARVQRRIALSSVPAESFRGQFDLMGQQIDQWVAAGLTTVLSTSQRKRVTALINLKSKALVAEYDEAPELQPGAYVGTLPLNAGFRLPEARLAVLTDREIFGYQRAVVPRRRRRDEVRLTSLADLQVGDYVVHIHHGIGQYAGIVNKTIEGVERDYLQINYAGEDRLFVPTPQVDRVQKYIGGEGAAPRIHRLSESAWQRTRRRAKQSTEKLARELLRLYAVRSQTEGFAFSPDQPWQIEVEDAFIYEETPDQLRAIREVKRDMQSRRPMDRLVCGDVGFGKTEVAVRAALKAVLDGKQVAVLAPTTVLAQQHLNTFLERLGAYPIRIDLLSRFRTQQQQRQTVRDLADGKVDIVIGTHRILSDDVQFRDLGLLVVDEEQRFGVAHKEKLKKLAAGVDVLTLTATPIPRTLHMSLSGVRDMSLINDPPQGRVAIRTFCAEENDELIREAITRELEREGQVYFVHNRVQSIQHAAQRVKKLVPQARIAVAHGQMNEETLERVMMDFYAGEHDVLVCTSIIESGLDVPNVNTIIVQDADRFGLAQLYQLRGRVGRSSRQAYSYFVYRYPHRMTREAEERLVAIKEFTELGSGFKIAMRDLEIRGAGNLLGAEQHGHIVAVGFELYCQMLSEAVRQLKGEKVDNTELPPVELPIDAYLPADYIPSEGHRLDLYRRISAVRDHQALNEIEAEIADRFGPPPEEARNLIRLLRFRISLAERGLYQAPADPAVVLLRTFEHRPRELTPFEQSGVRRFARQYLRQAVRDIRTTGRRIAIRFVNATPAQKLAIMEGVLVQVRPLSDSPLSDDRCDKKPDWRARTWP